MIETIPPALDGERLDRVVAMLSARSRAEAAALVDSGAVRIDGAVVTARARRVEAGQVVAIELPPDAGTALAGDDAVAFTIAYEDADVFVVDKPAGLVVHPGAGNRTGTLIQGLLARDPALAAVGEADRPGVVHRLDKGTSGLLMVARTEPAREALVAQLSAREVDRRYLALVWGHLDTAKGAIEAPIGRSGRSPTRMAVSTRGRDARTTYEVLQAFRDPVDVTLVSCKLDTGRTHQLRVHLAAIGHPVVGDRAYGGARDGLRVERPFLHAAHLGFRHPRTGDLLAFDSSLPDDLRAVLESLH